MNKEEIEELKDFTIDLTDIDELALGLEVCSKKSNMIIQEFADTIIQLQQENQSLKKENKILRENAERNDKVVDKVNWENKHYKHIIDELEKWLEEEIKHYKEHFEFVCKSPSPVPVDDTKIILEKDDLIIQKLESTLNKLQELKGSDKE